MEMGSEEEKRLLRKEKKREELSIYKFGDD